MYSVFCARPLRPDGCRRRSVLRQALIAAITAAHAIRLETSKLAYSDSQPIGLHVHVTGCAGGDENSGNSRCDVSPCSTCSLHAFFKARFLFLSAGSVMHAMGDVIDMRRFSQDFAKPFRITHYTFLAGCTGTRGCTVVVGLLQT